MNRPYPFIALITIVSAVGFACSMPLSPSVIATPTETILPSNTVTPTLTAVSPLVTVTSGPTIASTTQPTATNTVVPPMVVIPTTAVPVVNASSGTCNLSTFEGDINYSDDTVVPAGQNFDKKWRLRNSGTCTWTSGYKVIFVSGDAMGGAGSVQLTNGTVEPGASVNVSVNLTAPSAPGTYRGNYLLQASDGTTFGIDAAKSFFYVRIIVENPNGDVPANEDESDDTEEAASPSIPSLSRNLKLTNPTMRGGDVISLQRKLLARGYSIVGAVDGVFGKKTDAGVRQFQADQGLVVDGVVGPKTWAALWN